jgi:hypothetical protein
MTKLLIAITSLGLFSVLASYSYGKYGPAWDAPTSYTTGQALAMNHFVEGVLFKPVVKPRNTMTDGEQAAALVYLWGASDE